MALTVVACGGGHNGFTSDDAAVGTNADGTTTLVPDAATPDAGVPETSVADVVARVDGAVSPTDGGGNDGGSGGDAGRADGGGAVACGTAPVHALNPAGETVTGTFSGTSSNAATSCQPSTGGQEAYFSLTLAAATHVRLVSSAGSAAPAATDTVLEIRRTCTDATSQLACNDDSGGLFSRIDTTLQPGTYAIVLDQFTRSAVMNGSYTLTYSTLAAAPTNATCGAGTLALTSGVAVTGQDLSQASGTASACTFGDEIPQLYYGIDVPAGQRLSVTVTAATGATFQPIVSLANGCSDSDTCFGASDSSATGPVTQGYNNRTAGTVHAIVAVSSDVATPTGTFSLTATLATAPPVPTNSICPTGATPLVTGASIPGEDPSSSETIDSPCFDTGFDNPELFYSVTVPVGQRLTVTATPAAGATIVPYLRLESGCTSDDTCVAHGGPPTTGTGPSVLTYTNRGTADANYLVAVVAGASSQTGAYGLSATLETLAVAPNATCAGATSVTPGTTVTGQSTSSAMSALLTTSACAARGGATLYYSVNIPTGSTLTATVVPIGTWNPTIRLLPACGSPGVAAQCTAGVNAGAGGAQETLSFTNSGAALNAILAVAGATPTDEGEFSLAVSLGTTPGNAACPSATPVSNGTTLTGEDSAAGLDDRTPTCLPSASGTVLYYSASVPPGNVLTATANAQGGWFPAIRVIDSCAATTCLAAGAGPGPSASANYTNNSVSTVNVIFAVGGTSGASGGNGGLFDLVTSIGPAPYLTSTIAGACDTLDASATTVALDSVFHSGTDDAATAITALPFAFTYFGDTVTRFSATTNGYAQLYAASGGDDTRSVVFSDTALPSLGAPRGIVAPFWDDLYLSATGAAIRTETFGTGSARHFTIEWTHDSFSGGADNLTFQARLFEGTNVIDFQYCALTAATGNTARATGTSATVGIQDLSGTRGVTYESDSATVHVTTANAVRFTPNL